ncbi:hypothetical protein Golax_021807 [Gossypium laxum]|uniref:Uncharacterized protein n=1 Tax=Gossypium laxum TaxID=34288 RepID=A0A7J9AMH2_9ROSI|nr:hypothetical protein [Gossypium laxum]
MHKNEMSTYPTPPTDYSWLSIGSKDCSSNRFQIPTSSIMKFRFECEEFPLSPTKFGSNFQPIQGWESWVNKIHLRMKRLFFMVGVYDVVQVTFKLLIHREKRIETWYSILSRWSTVSHTIITTWGGFIFTLEDVNVLLELPCENSSLEFLEHKYESEASLGRFSACAPPSNPSPSPATSSNKFVGNNYKEKDLVIGKGGEVSTNEPSNHYDVDFLDDEMEDNTAIF